MGITWPMLFDRWEIAGRGRSSSMRRAKSRAISGEYGPPLDAIVAYDRETGDYLLIVRSRNKFKDAQGGTGGDSGASGNGHLPLAGGDEALGGLEGTSP